jgi:hypothetical protein
MIDSWEMSFIFLFASMVDWSEIVREYTPFLTIKAAAWFSDTLNVRALSDCKKEEKRGKTKLVI